MKLDFVFNDTATTEIYTLSLHDALPISGAQAVGDVGGDPRVGHRGRAAAHPLPEVVALQQPPPPGEDQDRKSTRLNSSHANISYAVFCLKKKNYTPNIISYYALIATDIS